MPLFFISMIKNIIFDFGGVLVDLDRDEAARRFLSLGVHDIEDLLDPYLQRGIFLELERGTYSASRFEDLLNEQYHLSLTHQQVSWAVQGFIKEVPLYTTISVSCAKSTTSESLATPTPTFSKR